MKRMTREWVGEAALSVVAVGFHVIAFWMASFGILIIGYCAAMIALTRIGTVRRGFYCGLMIGGSCAAVHLHFLSTIFGWGALSLWGVLGLWTGLFLAISRAIRLRLPNAWVWFVPFIWVGLEYTRSELYPLRFSWLAPGMALSHPYWNWLATLGYYGFGFMVILFFSVLSMRAPWRNKLAVTSLALVGILSLGMISRPATGQRQSTPYVAGIQFEFADERQVLKGLDRLVEVYPEAELVVLSEYSFPGPIPDSIRSWCVKKKVHLIAGGKEPTGDGPNDFKNTIFVVSPLGEIIHKQTKSVPIQFFNDGEPAESQEVWHSPWGIIGIAICYDLSYSKVMDRFVSAGAQALIIPTMDVSDWGEYEHRLHAKMPYLRAREYGLPIFRVASSGVSQLVSAQGETIASAPFPGPGRTLGGRMTISNAGNIPFARWIAKLSVLVAGGVLLALLWERARKGALRKRIKNAIQ